MNNLEKEYSYLIEKAFGSDEEENKAFEKILKRTGGFVSVEEKDTTFYYRLKTSDPEVGDTLDLDILRVCDALRSAGYLEKVENPDTFLDEEELKAFSVAWWNPFYDYLKKLRAEIAANPDFDPQKDILPYP